MFAPVDHAVAPAGIELPFGGLDADEQADALSLCCTIDKHSLHAYDRARVLAFAARATENRPQSLFCFIYVMLGDGRCSRDMRAPFAAQRHGAGVCEVLTKQMSLAKVVKPLAQARLE